MVLKRLGALADRLARLQGRARALAWALGVLSSLGVTGGAVGLAVHVRRQGDLMTDQPEYVTNQTTPADPATTRTGFPAWVDWGLVRWAAVALLILIGIRIIARWPMRRPDNHWDRDPRRLFSDTDKRWCYGAAGGRCEWRGPFGRCHNAIREFDHWYPWAKGGATARTNLVGLCRKHNRRKSDKVPTLWATRRLAHARRRYWTGGDEYLKPTGIAPGNETDTWMEDTDASEQTAERRPRRDRRPVQYESGGGGNAARPGYEGRAGRRDGRPDRTGGGARREHDGA